MSAYSELKAEGEECKLKESVQLRQLRHPRVNKQGCDLTSIPQPHPASPSPAPLSDRDVAVKLNENEIKRSPTLNAQGGKVQGATHADTEMLTNAKHTRHL